MTNESAWAEAPIFVGQGRPRLFVRWLQKKKRIEWTGKTLRHLKEALLLRAQLTCPRNNGTASSVEELGTQ